MFTHGTLLPNKHRTRIGWLRSFPSKVTHWWGGKRNAKKQVVPLKHVKIRNKDYRAPDQRSPDLRAGYLPVHALTSSERAKEGSVEQSWHTKTQ